ncbi:rod shape-determining protein MreD [Agitococcus lubricus]|uniref:Rod shape-determining protein MreD n=1 Tax=Agitococcus lubricus TaxID=1077255 RepID=A0A2T5ITR1_9GAMM|nr:rod shape-determining protein MreD [Agitococcus lubricus]PTQ87235.1 rod shape-determining protein MreD [Agitococcus lubricus]
MKLAEPKSTLPLSFVLAFLWALYPLPPELALWRPDLMQLLLIFWGLHYPHKVSIGVNVVLGLALALMLNQTLGIYALSWAVSAYLNRLYIRRARMSSALVTTLWVCFLVTLAFSLRFFIYALIGQAYNGWQYALPIITTTLAWPLVVMSLQRWRRDY